MSDVLASFGVDAAKAASLKTQTGPKYPDPVPNRVAHIDADFMAYQVSAESKAELDPKDPTPRKTYEDMLHNAYEAVDHIRLLAGAEKAVLHTTHNSDKGGRDSIAILKPYQANRTDRTNKPENLDRIREYLGNGVGCTDGTFVGHNHTNQEADDGMAQAQYQDPENAIVCSMDKDLLMVPGLKLDMYTGKIFNVKSTFGRIYIKEKTSSSGKVTKKVTGEGTKFFWLQLLMGDKADNISGLPECPGSIWQEYSGTQAYRDAMVQLSAYSGDDPKTLAKLNERVDKLKAKTKKCSQMLAYDILADCRTDEECFKLVRTCYALLEKEHGYQFKHWDTGKPVTATQAMLSEMKLLWMRQQPGENDVMRWLKEVL